MKEQALQQLKLVKVENGVEYIQEFGYLKYYGFTHIAGSSRIAPIYNGSILYALSFIQTLPDVIANAKLTLGKDVDYYFLLNGKPSKDIEDISEFINILLAELRSTE
jgi:hypothetical protein